VARHTKKELRLILMARRVCNTFAQQCGANPNYDEIDPDMLDVVRGLTKAAWGPYEAEFPDYRGLI